MGDEVHVLVAVAVEVGGEDVARRAAGDVGDDGLERAASAVEGGEHAAVGRDEELVGEAVAVGVVDRTLNVDLVASVQCGGGDDGFPLNP